MPDDHERLLLDILEAAWGRRDAKWRERPFEIAKLMSTTEKGNAVEDFAAALFRQTGQTDVERHHSRRGDWDIRVGGTTFEVKCATMDTGGNFQFNGIRYDTKYDRLLVIGIAPDAVYFDIYRKQAIIDLPLVPMRKGSNSDFKLTRPPSKLRRIAEFGRVFGNLTA